MPLRRMHSVPRLREGDLAQGMLDGSKLLVALIDGEQLPPSEESSACNLLAADWRTGDSVVALTRGSSQGYRSSSSTSSSSSSSSSSGGWSGGGRSGGGASGSWWLRPPTPASPAWHHAVRRYRSHHPPAAARPAHWAGLSARGTTVDPPQPRSAGPRRRPSARTAAKAG